MGLFRIVNVPSEKSGVHIVGSVSGEMVDVACHVGRDPNPSVGICSTFVGDHMFKDPLALRQMYAQDLAFAIEKGRDAGYAQAMQELRDLIGVAPR